MSSRGGRRGQEEGWEGLRGSGRGVEAGDSAQPIAHGTSLIWHRRMRCVLRHRRGVEGGKVGGCREGDT